MNSILLSALLIGPISASALDSQSPFYKKADLVFEANSSSSPEKTSGSVFSYYELTVHKMIKNVSHSDLRKGDRIKVMVYANSSLPPKEHFTAFVDRYFGRKGEWRLIQDSQNMNWGDGTPACKAKGGYIEEVCASASMKCITRYPDAGKTCANSSECLGGCVQAGTPAKNGDVKGVCKENNQGCGSGCWVENGKAAMCSAAD